MEKLLFLYSLYKLCNNYFVKVNFLYLIAAINENSLNFNLFIFKEFNYTIFLCFN